MWVIFLVWNIVWNATATFIAVIIISLLLDESGFFEWAALHVSRWGNGRGRLLFTYIVLLGAAVAALFANDGAALILTPIVIAMLLALGFSKGTTLAFVMAAGFIADTASLPLIVSNLVNIVSADFFGLGFTEYASVMVPVDIAAIIATLVMLHLFFRKDIPPTYDLALLKAPAKAIKDLATFRTGWIVLILLLVGFFVLEPLGIPLARLRLLGLSSCLRWRNEAMPLTLAKCFAVRHGRSSSSLWDVSGGLWSAQRRANRIPLRCAERAGR
jgi:arsenical pump membrane protein